MKSEEFLRSYIRGVLQETIVKIGDDDYDIPQEKVEQLKSYISKSLGIKKFDPNEYLAGFKAYPEAASEIQALLKTAYPQTPAVQNAVKRHISAMYPAEISALLSEKKEPGGTVTVPEGLFDLAEFGTPGSSGTQIGRGELVIPLLFVDSKLATTSNDPYDATISGQKWHVKEGKPTVGIRMGSAKGKSFADTRIYKVLIDTGVVSASDLFNIGAQDLSRLLTQIVGAAAGSDLKIPYLRTIEGLYDELSRQATIASVGEAAGILWYSSGIFTFTPTEELGLKYFTQGRAVLSVNSKAQVLKYLEPKPEPKKIQNKKSQKGIP